MWMAGKPLPERARHQGRAPPPRRHPGEQRKEADSSAACTPHADLIGCAMCEPRLVAAWINEAQATRAMHHSQKRQDAQLRQHAPRRPPNAPAHTSEDIPSPDDVAQTLIPDRPTCNGDLAKLIALSASKGIWAAATVAMALAPLLSLQPEIMTTSRPTERRQRPHARVRSPATKGSLRK